MTKKEEYENYQNLISKAIDSINKLSSIKSKKVNRFIEEINCCEGKIIFSGVGKSGSIAKKNSETFASLGIPSIFLDPLNAAHGNLGALDKKDLVLMISNSGSNTEIINLIDAIKHIGCKIIAVTSNKDSNLVLYADDSIILPKVIEMDDFDLAPTNSSLIYLAFMDIIGIIISKKNNFTKKDFAITHPGGLLGKRLTKKVRDLMVPYESSPIIKDLDSPVISGILEMSAKSIGLLTILDKNDEIIGVFSDGDTRRLISLNNAFIKEKMIDHYKRNPLFIDYNSLAFDALKLMRKNNIQVLPVVDNKKFKGTIKLIDIVQYGINDD